jgi:hypothetical protein
MVRVAQSRTTEAAVIVGSQGVSCRQIENG